MSSAHAADPSRAAGSRVGLWAKEVSGAVGAGLVVALTALEDGRIVTAEGIAIALSVLGALGLIKAVKNATAGPLYAAKAGIAVLVPFGGSIGAGFADGNGLQQIEVLTACLALVNAVPVFFAANTTAESDDLAAARGSRPPAPAPPAYVDGQLGVPPGAPGHPRIVTGNGVQTAPLTWSSSSAPPPLPDDDDHPHTRGTT